jgi:hypothetical protein
MDSYKAMALYDVEANKWTRDNVIKTAAIIYECP